jgi:hypothetical protein
MAARQLEDHRIPDEPSQMDHAMITIVDQHTADAIHNWLMISLGAAGWAIIHNIGCEILDRRDRHRARRR